MIKPKLILLCLICLAPSILFSQHIEISDNTQISLLTCSPGPAGYEKFGHSAIRIFDEAQNVDIVANWGLFDFDKPNFYYKFVKGETYYLLGIHPTYYFLESYKQRNSSVTEQVLNLDSVGKQQIVDRIMLNNLPENREYLYNFIYDNCSTRPRDFIFELFDGHINYQTTNEMEEKSFRQWVAQYAGKDSWMMFGIDLVFGRKADQLASNYEAMFLPEILQLQMEDAKIESRLTDDSLISESHFLVEKLEQEKSNIADLLKPLLVAAILLIIGVIITIFELIKKRRFTLFDSMLYLVVGIGGVIIFYLMFFSIHPLVNSNINLLWMNPLFLILSFSIWKKQKTAWIMWLQIAIFVCLLLALILLLLKVQSANIAFIPVISLLIIRLLSNIKRSK